MHVPYFIVQGLRTGSKRFIQRCGNKRVNIRDLNVKLDSKKRGTIFPFLKKKIKKKKYFSRVRRYLQQVISKTGPRSTTKFEETKKGERIVDLGSKNLASRIIYIIH